MEDKIITLPIKSYSEQLIGTLIVPSIAEVMRHKLDTEATLSVNLLDSFQDRGKYYEGFYNLIKDNNIKLDNVWIDSKNKDELKDCIYNLINKGYIQEKEKEIKRCKCNKVEINSEILENKKQGKLYTKVGDNLVCNECHSVLETSRKKVLIFKVPEKIGENIKIIPSRLKKSLINMNKYMENKEIVISRNRNTGISVDYDNTKYNIDVDFFWANYLDLIKGKEKLVIGCEEVLYPIYLTSILEKIRNPNSNTVYLAVPFVNGLEKDVMDYNKLDNKEAKKLTLIFSATKLKNSRSKWDDNTYKYFNKFNSSKMKEFKNILYSKIDRRENESFYDYVDRVVLQEMNYQKVLKKFNQREVVR